MSGQETQPRRADGVPAGESTPPRHINDLPPHVLTHILSFLPTRTVATTSVVCKAWRRLWANVPRLILEQYLPGRDDASCRWFVDLVEGMLRGHNLSSLRDVSLCFCPGCPESGGSEWIRRFMSGGGITAFCLDFSGMCDQHVGREVPRNIWRGVGVPGFCWDMRCDAPASLASLYVRHCKLVTTGSGGFPGLCILRLHRVMLPEGSLRDIISKCPVLEKLDLSYLLVHDDLVGCAPALRLRFICLNVVELSVEGSLRGIIAKCPVLEDLHMFDVAAQEDLVISSPDSQLRRLSMRSCVNSRAPMSFEIQAPRLSVFNFTGRLGSRALLDTHSQPIAVSICTPRLNERLSVDRLIEFLVDLRGAQSLHLDSGCVQVLPVKNNMTESFPNPFTKLKQISLFISLSKYEFPGIACLLRSSPILESLLINFSGSDPCMTYKELEVFKFDEDTYWDSVGSCIYCLVHHLKKICK